MKNAAEQGQPVAPAPSLQPGLVFWPRGCLLAQALLWRLLGRQPALLAVLTQLLARLAPHQPGYAWSLGARMLAYQQTGQTALALADAQALVALYTAQNQTSPSVPPARLAAAFFNLGYLLEQQAQHLKQPPTQLPTQPLKQSTKQPPEQPAAEHAAQLEAAAQAFEAAVQHQPELDAAWYGLGLVRLRQAQWEAAQTALTRCTELQAFSPHAWYQLARLHAEQGRMAQAQRIVQRLQDFEPAVAAQLARQLGLV